MIITYDFNVNIYWSVGGPCLVDLAGEMFHKSELGSVLKPTADWTGMRCYCVPFGALELLVSIG